MGTQYTKNTMGMSRLLVISTSFDIAGVDIDEQTGKMYLYAYENLYPNYNRYLYEVNPTSVGLNINGSWLLGSSSDFSGTATGLVVDLPRVIAGTDLVARVITIIIASRVYC